MIKEYIKQLEGVSFDFLLSSLKRLVVGEKKLTNLELINDFIHKRSAHVTQNTLYGYLQTRIGGNYIKAFKDENYLKSINISRWNIFVISVQDISFYIFSYLYKNQNYQKFEEAKKIYHKIVSVTGDYANPGVRRESKVDLWPCHFLQEQRLARQVDRIFAAEHRLGQSCKG